jgi:hypothetical protein
MDPIQIETLKSRVNDLELKVRAILDALQLELKYDPEKYTLVQPSKEEDGEDE